MLINKNKRNIHHLGFQDSLRGLVMAALHIDFFDQEHVVLHHLASTSLKARQVAFVCGSSLHIEVYCARSSHQSTSLTLHMHLKYTPDLSPRTKWYLKSWPSFCQSLAERSLAHVSCVWVTNVVQAVHGTKVMSNIARLPVARDRPWPLGHHARLDVFRPVPANICHEFAV